MSPLFLLGRGLCLPTAPPGCLRGPPGSGCCEVSLRADPIAPDTLAKCRDPATHRIYMNSGRHQDESEKQNGGFAGRAGGGDPASPWCTPLTTTQRQQGKLLGEPGSSPRRSPTGSSVWIDTQGLGAETAPGGWGWSLEGIWEGTAGLGPPSAHGQDPWSPGHPGEGFPLSPARSLPARPTSRSLARTSSPWPAGPRDPRPSPWVLGDTEAVLRDVLGLLPVAGNRGAGRGAEEPVGSDRLDRGSAAGE